MIKSTKTDEQRLTEATEALQGKRDRMQKVVNDADLAQSRADLARKEYSNEYNRLVKKFPSLGEDESLSPDSAG